MDLIVADNEWVEDRGDGAPSDRKERRNRVCREDIRVARTEGEILSNFTSRFRLTAKLHQQCLNLLPLLLGIMPSCLVSVPLPTKRTVPSTSGLMKNETDTLAAPRLVLRRLWLQDGNSILQLRWCVRP